MIKEAPRIRMFAGPNGSGKSTIKSMLRPDLLGIYINPDEIEKEIRRYDFLDLKAYYVNTNKNEIIDFFLKSSLLKTQANYDDVHQLKFNDGKLFFISVSVNAYYASVAADFIRHKLLEHQHSFTFETVMSSSDKIEFLRKAQNNGYRTYLYYIATEDPAINLSRIRHRVKMGGHSVPEDKIITRYKRSIELLPEALQYTNRCYIFDNSTQEHIWIAEITEGKIMEVKTEFIPEWLKNSLKNKFQLN